MLSYQVKISEGCFVWAAPTLRTGAIIRNRTRTFFECLLEVRNSNPARVKAQGVKAREEVQNLF
jgi:hypothetical protein